MTDYSGMSDYDLMAEIGNQPSGTNNAGNMKAPDGSFQSFDSPQAGVDAMRTDLIGKVSGTSPAMKDNYGENYDPTLRNVLTTWAPPTENNTDNYVNYVSGKSGIDPDATLSKDDIDKIIPHMITMEHGAEGAKQYASADNGNMTDATVDGKPDYSKMSDDELRKAIGQQPSSLIDALKNQPDTSFVSNYGQGFLDTANRARIGMQQLGQDVGNAVYGANPRDVGETASNQAALAQLDKEKTASGIVPSGFVGGAGNLLGSIAGNPSSYLPMGEISGIGDLARAGAIQGGATSLTEANKNDAGLGSRLLSGAVGAGEGAASAAALGIAGKAIGEIPSGVSNRIKGAFGTDTAEDIAAQSDKNWDAASQSFKNSRAAGAVLTPEAGQQVLANVKSAVDSAGILNPSRHGDTVAALSDLQNDVDNGSLTLEKLDQHRQAFGDAVKDNTTKLEGTNSDGYRALQAKNSIVDSIGNLGSDAYAVGNPAAGDSLRQGINQWAQAARYDRIANIINNAAGDAGKLKTGFTNFLKNPNNTKGFNDQEVAALQDAAARGTGEKLEQALGAFGFDLNRGVGNVIPAITSGSSAIIPGGLPAAAVGTALRQTGKYAARGKAQSVLDAVMGRDMIPAVVSTPNAQLPVKLQGTASQYVNSKSGALSKFFPNSDINIHGNIAPEEEELQGTASTYINPNAKSLYAKGGIVKNREITLTKKLQEKIGRVPKQREIEMATYVGPHGVHRLLKQTDIKLEAYKMFPQAIVKEHRSLFFNKNKPYTVNQIRKVLV